MLNTNNRRPNVNVVHVVLLEVGAVVSQKYATVHPPTLNPVAIKDWKPLTSSAASLTGLLPPPIAATIISLGRNAWSSVLPVELLAR